MQLRDCHVSHKFLDRMEELDLWVPYIDPESPNVVQALYSPTPVYSVFTFQQLCELSKLMVRNITSTVGAYRSAYSLRGGPYLTSYVVYVSFTIHVRNAALEGDQNRETLKLLLASLRMLDELFVPNPGVCITLCDTESGFGARNTYSTSMLFEW
jgi:hypothetical protein